MWPFRKYIEEIKVKAKLEKIISTICPNNFNFFIAGGVLTALFSNQKVNDIDIFFSSLKDYNALYDYFFHKSSQKTETDNAVTFYGPHLEKFQLIKKFMTPEETIKQFDFTVCSAAYIPHNNVIIKNKLFLPHIKNRVLAINEGKDLWLSYKRVEKYRLKGYKFDGDLTSFCSRCHHRFFCLVNKTQKCKKAMADYNF